MHISTTVITIISLIYTYALRLAYSSPYYVDLTATGSSTGADWINAFTSLEDAIAAATLNSNPSQRIIYLMGGQTFYPSTTNQADCFETPSQLRIYGGFMDSTSSDLVTGRSDDVVYASKISGDIGILNEASDNCYHVMRFNGELTLDLITISDGHANDDSNIINTRGGGLKSVELSQQNIILHFIRVTFKDNFAMNGGAIWIGDLNGQSAYVSVSNCTFTSNDAFGISPHTGKGGAIYIQQNELSTLSIQYSSFSNNFATFRGGAIYHDGAYGITIDGNSFQSNNCDGSGGAIFGEQATKTTPYIPSVIISGNDFYSNSAMRFGGAICWRSFRFQCLVDDNWFENNILHSTGGQGNAIALLEGATKLDLIPNMDTNEFVGTQVMYEEDTLPNIILIFVDDLEYTQNTATMFGAPTTSTHRGRIVNYMNVDTPAVTSLLQESISFRRPYTMPVCSASRYSILTGRVGSRNWYSTQLAMSDTDGSVGADVRVSEMKMDNVDSTDNLQTLLQLASYRTGMVGKWHLTPIEEGCESLNDQSNAALYETCRQKVMTQGWDFVDAYYDGNIGDNTLNSEFSHNPEWVVQQSTQFMNARVAEEEPFFLYFAPTIPHLPEMVDALQNHDSSQTPKGILTDVPDLQSLGMKSRTEIYNEAVNIAQTLGYPLNRRRGQTALETIAGHLWLDDSIKALMAKVEKLGIRDNTVVVFSNDHGQGAKHTLYEHGTRMIHGIRYPRKLGDNGYVLPEDFVISSVDTTATLLQLASVDIAVTAPSYVMDGVSYLNDITTYIANEESGDPIDYTINPPSCCQYKFLDIFRSHAIVDKNWKYIFRATNEYGRTSIVRWFPHHADVEQLYNLNFDSAEQVNLVNANETETQSTLDNFRQLMIDYIIDQVCWSTPAVSTCVVPQLTT